MNRSHLFTFDQRPALPAGSIRLTRLNIYAGLYIEYRSTRVLVDPTRVLPHVEADLRPDLILVSHESMDHFDPALCRRLLEHETTMLLGSWGVIVRLAEYLEPEDPVWRRILVGLPGTSVRFGDLAVHVEAARHCEYPVPIFFDIQDTVSGFRILDAVDSEITPRMEQRGSLAHPDLLIVPLGIALAARPAVAWKMVELLEPSVVFANHFTDEGDEFLATAPDGYTEETLVVLDWYEGVTLPGPDPNFDPHPQISVHDPLAYPALAPLQAQWVEVPPTEDAILDYIGGGDLDSPSLSMALYFLAWNALRRGAGAEAVKRVDGLRSDVLGAGDDELSAAYLLALGAVLGSASGADAAVDLGSLRELLSIDQPYLAYWVLECWGRCAKNPGFRDVVIGLLDDVVADESLYGVVAVRRKLLWEVDRLVELGYVWPSLSGLLAAGRLDHNPDVRLLTYKVLPLCHTAIAGLADLLAHGLADEHEDVLEWAILAHIRLFAALEPCSRGEVAARLPSLLTHPNYHVRNKAGALAELSRWPPP